MYLLINKHRTLPVRLKFENGENIILNCGKRMQLEDITKIVNLDSIRTMLQYVFVDTPKEEKTTNSQYTPGEDEKVSRKKRGGKE